MWISTKRFWKWTENSTYINREWKNTFITVRCVAWEWKKCLSNKRHLTAMWWLSTHLLTQRSLWMYWVVTLRCSMPCSASYDEEGGVTAVMFKLSCHRPHHKLNWQHAAPMNRYPDRVGDLVIEPLPTVYLRWITGSVYESGFDSDMKLSMTAMVTVSTRWRVMWEFYRSTVCWNWH